MRKVRNGLIATALACSLAVTPVFAEPATGTGAAQSNLQDQKKAAEGQVSSLQTQLTSLMTKMDQIQMDLISTGEEIIAAQSGLEAAQLKEEKQYEDMKLRIKYMYEEGNGTALEKIFSSGSITEMLNRAEYVNSVHTYDREQLDVYVETKNEIAELKTTLETEMASLEDMQAQYETQKTELSTTLESKSTEVANLDVEIQAAAAAAAEAARVAAEQEAARAAQAAQAAANSANGGGGSTPEATPPSSGGGSTPEYTPPSGGDFVPDNNSGAAQTIVSAAWSQIGVPYVWGGTSPYSGLDCSGLTQWCHAQAGISIGRIDTAQLAGGRQVSDPQPGDIAWTPGHVAIYIGNGQMIEAQQPGTTICVSSVRASVYVRYW